MNLAFRLYVYNKQQLSCETSIYSSIKSEPQGGKKLSVSETDTDQTDYETYLTNKCFTRTPRLSRLNFWFMLAFSWAM